ncbi:MAG: nucleotidyltransferase domain-containing protein [Actinomycetota bacterium]
MLKTKLPLVRVILFGSYAKGNYTVGSDIDLLVVYEGPQRQDAFALTKKILDIPHLEPHLYTKEEYNMLESVINRMVKNGIELSLY